MKKSTYVIRYIRREEGFALLNTLIFILFLGLMGITLVTLVVSDARMQTVNINESRAFYAAQSGMEYAVRGILETSAKHSVATLHNYKEKISTGAGTFAQITIRLPKQDSIVVQSVGISQGYARTLIKGMSYSDISDYAVYTSGDMKYVVTIPPKSYKKFAANMPLFDYDELRNLAKPTQYFPGDLVVNHFFNFHRNITFVEKNLIFGTFNWINVGNFVAGRSVLIKTSPWPFGLTFGNIYLPFKGSTFLSQWQIFSRVLSGGLIANGDVTGTTKKWWYYRFIVIRNRSRIKQLMRLSVNGGPLVINHTTWQLKQ